MTAGVRWPDFIIGGVTKAGTSSLWTHLRSHPQVCLPPRKELAYFTRNWYRGAAWYTSHFAACPPDMMTGEAAPDYLYHPEAAGRIHAAIPAVKLIFSLRDPVERAYSHYWMRVKNGLEWRSFEACVQADIGGGSDRSSGAARFRYVSVGRYHEHLSRFLELFPASQIHVLVFEEFVRDPLPTLRSVYRFLGLSEDHVPPDVGRPVNPITRRTDTVRSRHLALPFIAARAPLAVASRYVPALTAAHQNLSRRLKFLHRRLNVVAGEVPEMNPETRRRLREYFTPEVERIEALLGRKLSDWDPGA